MVTDNLAVCFYFEVEIRFKLPNSFRNILVDNFITRSLMKILLYKLLPAFSLTIIATFLLNFLYNLFFIFSQCVEEFYFRRLVRMELLFFIINDLLFLSWSVQKYLLHAEGQITLGLSMIDLQRSVNTNLIAIFFICSVREELEDKLLRKLLPQVNFECTNTRLSTLEGTVNVVLGIQMPEDNFISEKY